MSTPLPPVPTGRQRRLEAQFLVTTPMFIGDATQQAVSIRPPSLKGALRFWWRALQWPRIYQEEKATASALKRLHREEAELFGLAARKDAQGHEVGGQARVTLRVESTDVEPGLIHIRENSSLPYLLGLGLFRPGKPPKGGVQRNTILPGGRFTSVLVGRPGRNGPTDAQWQSLEEALLVFGLLGGQGSRARKGLGSVSLQALTGGTRQAPQTAEEYRQIISELLGELPLEGDALPPFTAFSGLTRLDVSLQGDTPSALLEKLGNEMQLYRGFGRRGMVNGQPAEQKFRDDHDEMHRVATGEKPLRAPRRVIFGLPHNYFFSSDGAKLDISTQTSGDRRASPLFIHVHQLPSGECLATQLVMPAVFLPASESGLKFKSGKGRPEILPLSTKDIDWTVLHGLLDRFEQRITLLSPQTQQPREAQA